MLAKTSANVLSRVHTMNEHTVYLLYPTALKERPLCQPFNLFEAGNRKLTFQNFPTNEWAWFYMKKETYILNVIKITYI